MAFVHEINHNLVDTDNELLYKGLPIGFGVNYRDFFYVSTGGNDKTGVKGRPDLPFKSINGVITYCTANNTTGIVWVMPGYYAEKVALETYGPIKTLFLQDATIESTDAGFTLGMGHESKVFGRGKISNVGNGNAIRGLNSPGLYNIYLDGLLIESASGNTVQPIGFQITNLKNCTVKSAAGYCFYAGYGGTVINKAKNVEIQSGASAIYCEYGAGNSGFYEDCTIQGNDYGVYSHGGNLRFSRTQVKSVNATALHLSSGPNDMKLLLDFCRIEAVHHALTIHTTGLKVDHCQLVSTATGLAVDMTAGTPNYDFEFFNSKLIASVSASFAIRNLNATNNKVSLINCILNKEWNSNIAGILDNVSVNENLKYLNPATF